eukprot:CAMPEP_0180723076 /NCGR_PEP_ID=MMETSP1038_2-20121128/16842_1 /TAXON_ID=632150 /ORGANISM="Azadinium spinosum, Strain 3D9" /LENGTH=149 /DNA_ID=CAMNT_0022755643 /DNA_START=39 /DNA_END=488 /DNA_ORIENTATION=-
MGRACCQAGFGSCIQQCRQGPALWVISMLLWNFRELGGFSNKWMWAGVAESLILVIAGSEESDFIIGKKALPIKAALNGSWCCGFMMQTIFSLGLGFLSLRICMGNVTSSLWGGVYITFLGIELVNLTCLPIVFLMRMASKGKKVTKKD